jgi:hypothetical protein
VRHSFVYAKTLSLNLNALAVYPDVTKIRNPVAASASMLLKQCFAPLSVFDAALAVLFNPLFNTHKVLQFSACSPRWHVKASAAELVEAQNLAFLVQGDEADFRL